MKGERSFNFRPRVGVSLRVSGDCRKEVAFRDFSRLLWVMSELVVDQAY